MSSWRSHKNASNGTPQEVYYFEALPVEAINQKTVFPILRRQIRSLVKTVDGIRFYKKFPTKYMFSDIFFR